ncbi:hypothetical protein SLEP1_g38484 [Rubroshorea leprosula]|nr:hypothetical protein SLEP1_g38484 [Rubroshorea leprosula]
MNSPAREDDKPGEVFLDKSNIMHEVTVDEEDRPDVEDEEHSDSENMGANDLPDVDHEEHSDSENMGADGMCCFGISLFSYFILFYFIIFMLRQERLLGSSIEPKRNSALLGSLIEPSNDEPRSACWVHRLNPGGTQQALLGSIDEPSGAVGFIHRSNPTTSLRSSWVQIDEPNSTPRFINEDLGKMMNARD